jgi:hypothetical protein
MSIQPPLKERLTAADADPSGRDSTQPDLATVVVSRLRWDEPSKLRSVAG